jgi:transcriptional regulator with XRE-family HTH domain
MKEKLTKLREAKNLSQRQLAKELNISAGTISKIESEDQKNITIDKLLAVAKYFNVSTDYLLEHNLDSSKEVSNIALSKEELKDLVDSLDDLSSKIKSLLDE